ncbi:hypothetical protein I5U65_20880 [Stenotrophomonas maltophilia]|nr:hypothetical protein [Stenotrophomonas maltophilia]
MCSKAKILDPAGLLTGKNAKWADPLGVTKTAIGDPTGDIRKERAKVAAQAASDRKAQDDAKNVLPNALADANRLAAQSTESTLNQRLKRRSSYAVSLLGSAGG